MKLVWLERAVQDRDQHFEFIAQDNPSAAITQDERLEQQTALLLTHSDIGRAGRKKTTRELVISRTPLVVVYRVRPKLERVEILRVLHSSQQWP